MTPSEYNALKVGDRVRVTKSGKIYEVVGGGECAATRQSNELSYLRSLLEGVESGRYTMTPDYKAHIEKRLAKQLTHPIQTDYKGFYQIRNGFRYGAHQVLKHENIEKVIA